METFLAPARGFLGLAPFDRIANGADQAIFPKMPLHEIILCAFMHRTDAHALIAQAGHDDDGNPVGNGLDGEQRVQPGAIREAEVTQDDIELTGREDRHRFPHAPDRSDLEAHTLNFSESALEHEQIAPAILHHEHADECCLARVEAFFSGRVFLGN